MKPRTLLCALALLLLAGCGAAPQGIPEGLTWTARTLQSQETGAILAAAEKTSIQDVPRLDLTAQVEGGTITLTDHASGETYTGTLSPAEDAAPTLRSTPWRFRTSRRAMGCTGSRNTPTETGMPLCT